MLPLKHPLVQQQSLTDSAYAHITRCIHLLPLIGRQHQHPKMFRESISSMNWIAANCLCIFSSILHCYAVLSDTSWLENQGNAHILHLLLCVRFFFLSLTQFKSPLWSGRRGNVLMFSELKVLLVRFVVSSPTQLLQYARDDWQCRNVMRWKISGANSIIWWKYVIS